MGRVEVSRISVIGLGKLGACLAAVAARRGFQTTGVDRDRAKVDAINAHEPPVYEPGLGRTLLLAGRRISATTSIAEAVMETEATLIIVPTPSTRSGAFTLKFVNACVRDIGRALRRKDAYHLVVVKSTVMPGSMDGAIKPVLEENSRKKVGAGLGLCYNPEFIALGDAIRGILQPGFVLIGESDRRAGDMMVQIQRRVWLNAPPVARMSFVNSEIAKLAVNSYITMKISFANTLAEVCEKLPGADVDVVTGAIGHDRRIGGDYLNGGMGFGGPCFPRDNLAFVHFASRLGAQALLPGAAQRVNHLQTRRLVRMVRSSLTKGRRSVGILGLSYKPGTNIVEASQAVILARLLADAGYSVHVYDPLANETARAVMGDKVRYDLRPRDVIARSDVCVIATPWKDFKVDSRVFRDKVVIDCWRVLRAGKKRPEEGYRAIGLGPRPPRSH